MTQRTISHYSILKRLGVGGMGEVYLAEDTRLDRKVALKLLLAEFVSNEDRLRRFVQEAKATAALSHPNIAHIYEVGEAAGTHFIAMEYIDGDTLTAKIRRNDYPLIKLLEYLSQVAEGLSISISGMHSGRRQSVVRTLIRNSEKLTTKEKQMGKLEGKIALITGANSGIGLATAKRFVNEGAYVFITGRRQSELAASVKEIGRNVTGVQGDVSNLGDLDRLFAQIKREKGRLDIVFANAGIATYASFSEITEEHYDSIFNINVKGLLFTVQKALPLMPDYSSVILNGSIVASKGLPANSVYSATKAAVRSFARTWTTDLKDRHIRVNAVSPGPIETPGLNDLVASTGEGEQRLKMLSNSVPLGRLGAPDEIAKAVVFLASDDSSYITGTELFVDGGFAQV